MKFIILVILALLIPSQTKTTEEIQQCVSAIAAASITAALNPDASFSTCSTCLGLCNIGDATAQTFGGYKQDCVDACECQGTAATYKAAFKIDACKSAFTLFLGITGILMMILLALLF